MEENGAKEASSPAAAAAEEQRRGGRRRPPNELLHELCKCVQPRLGIWAEGRDARSATTNALRASACMHAFLSAKFGKRKEWELEQRNKSCAVCGMEAWGRQPTGAKFNTCLGCRYFFLRNVRDSKWASENCSATGGSQHLNANTDRLQKCRKIGMQPSMFGRSKNPSLA